MDQRTRETVIDSFITVLLFLFFICVGLAGVNGQTQVYIHTDGNADIHSKVFVPASQSRLENERKLKYSIWNSVSTAVSTIPPLSDWVMDANIESISYHIIVEIEYVEDIEEYQVFFMIQGEGMNSRSFDGLRSTDFSKVKRYIVDKIMYLSTGSYRP